MIITYPNKILRQESKPVKTERIFSSEFKELIAKMRKAIKIGDGVGLAAVQIGILERVILVEINGRPEVFINPVISGKSWKKIAIEEGCLSVPGVHGYVKRSCAVTIKALNEAGEKITLKAQGLPAIIFQHEVDHTDGILFIDKLIKK